MLVKFTSNLLRYSVYLQPLRRNISATAVLGVDPVQQVFVDQIKKYRTLSEKQGGAVDAGAEFEQTKTEAIARIAKLYNVEDPNKFPTFNFEEPDLNQDETDFVKE